MPFQGRLDETTVWRRIHNLIWVSDWTPVGVILAVFFILTGATWMFVPGIFTRSHAYDLLDALTFDGLSPQLVWGFLVFSISAGSLVTCVGLSERRRMLFLGLMAALILFVAGSYFYGLGISASLFVYPFLALVEIWQIIRIGKGRLERQRR